MSPEPRKMTEPLSEEAGGPALWQRQPRVAIDQLFLSEKFKIGSLTITRCGSGFIKNLLYRLDNGKSHKAAMDIHDYGDDLARGSALSNVEFREYINFTVVRNPVDRFLAFYFGRIVGRNRYKYEWLFEAIKSDGGPEDRPISLEEHRQYCDFLIDWMERSFQGDTSEKPNALWMPQRIRINTARAINAKVLTLDGLNDQLFVLLGDRVENLRAQIAETPRTRMHERMFPKSELLSKDILSKINRIYRHDRQIWMAAREAWSDVDMSVADPSEAPELSGELS